MSSSTLPIPDLSSGVFTDTTPRDVAVSVRGLSKSYRIAKNATKHTSAGEAIMHKLRHPFEKVEKDTFWALNDVNFDIQKGDVVGIIGRNGAGKSTLLKILSRITEPTRGRIDLYGRVGSLLEVGTGFHPELTGSENIFLNGAILGMSKAEIACQFDAIVEFAEVEQFLDTPVKRYSSGMYVRLAFAVAAHLNPEILIVDEVLAVGDAEFQKKCLGKMRDVAEREGRTVIFVSHNMAAVMQLCNRAILLNQGSLLLFSEVTQVVEEYLNIGNSSNVFRPSKLNENGMVYIKSATISNPVSGQLRFDECSQIDVECVANEPLTVALELLVRDERGQPIISLPSGWMYGQNFLLGKNSVSTLSCFIPHLPLAEGKYYIDVVLAQSGYAYIERHESALQFEVIAANPHGTNMSYAQRYGQGCVYIDAQFSMNTQSHAAAR